MAARQERAAKRRVMVFSKNGLIKDRARRAIGFPNKHMKKDRHVEVHSTYRTKYVLLKATSRTEGINPVLEETQCRLRVQNS